jgi:hypothetical protein
MTTGAQSEIKAPGLSFACGKNSCHVYLIDLCCIILFVGATSGSICAIESGSESDQFELR